MIRILLLLGFVFYSLPSLATIVTAKAKYMHSGEISTNTGCEIAKDRAKLKALEKEIGQTISSEELEKCSEIDGKYNCERNRFFLSSFNGDITGLKELVRKKTTETLDDGKIVYYCEIEIKANVIPSKQITDPNFDFNVKLNKSNYNEGDNLTMEIGFTKPMYLTIFQVLPYEKKNNQVLKLFPNEREKDNFIKSEKIILPNNAKYEIYFPEKVNKERVDEYLFFITSDKNISWLPEYGTIEELKAAFHKLKKMMKHKFKQYTITK
jgi:hypothetical protein